MKLAIVGSRDFVNRAQFEEWVAEALTTWGIGVPEVVVSGGARGADTMGENWARSRDIPTQIYRPDWQGKGKAAGFIRNRDIIDEATHVLAFPSRKGKGTQHSIELAKQQKKPVLVYWID